MERLRQQLEDGGEFLDMQNLEFLNQADFQLTLTQWLMTYLRLPYHDYKEGEYEPHIAYLDTLLKKTEPVQRLKILAGTKGRFVGTFAQRAAYYKHCQVLSCILSSVTKEDRFELLKIQDQDGRTGLHKAAWKGFTKPMTQMLGSMDEVQQFISLQIATHNGWTPLFWAALNRCVPMIKCILNAVDDPGMRFGLAKTGVAAEETVLHLAAKRGYVDVIWAILDSLPSEQQYALLKVVDAHGKTAMDLASEGPQVKASHLLNAYQRGTVEISTLKYDNEFTELIQKVPVDYLSKLSTHSRQYFTPRNGSHRKNYAVILFNTLGRQGAVSEAECMENGLAQAGCEVIKLDWCTVYDLEEMLTKTLQELSDTCLSLSVCVMSHGGMGGVQGSGGEMMAVNAIIHRIDQIISKECPLIILLQACQIYDTQRRGDQNTDPVIYTETALSRDDKYIVLTRPHTALLLATVAGGEAVRGAYTKAITESLATADGKTCISQLHIKAVNKMRCEYGEMQNPEMRSTLQAKLNLPGRNR